MRNLNPLQVKIQIQTTFPRNVVRDTLGGGSELERIRGAAALASIGRSVNANRILNGARSSLARDIVDQSNNRVLYGNPNGPNE